jgi:hypothetical protein
MAAPDKAELFSRLRELHTHQGKTWHEIASILEGEGFEEKGKPLTANALRKRFTRWSKTEAPSKSPVESEPESKQEKKGSDFDRLQKSRMDFYSKPLEEAESTNSIAGNLEKLATLNSQLLEQVQDSNSLMRRLEKRLEEQESKTSHTEHTEEQPVTSRELLELIKEMSARREQQMQYIEEKKEYRMSREDIQQWIEESVQGRVESELKAMLAEEGSFSRQLTCLVDQRLRDLFSGGEPVVKTDHAGPGRGRKGKTHKKFSASLEESLFERVKSLPGQFSGHLSNALEAYLSVVKEKKSS